MRLRLAGSVDETWRHLRINLEPAAGAELGKVRPGIIVSNTIQNERLDPVVLVPLSTRAPEI